MLPHLLDKGMSPSELTGMLYRDSGLLGLSGISHDMRTLLNSDADTAQQAIDYYVFRIRRELGGLAAVLGGLDGLVFAWGIGENSAEIRARVLDGMEFLGLGVNEAANAANETRIGAGRTPVLVIQTDEERVIARAVVQRLGAGGATTQPKRYKPKLCKLLIFMILCIQSFTRYSLHLPGPYRLEREPPCSEKSLPLL